MLAITSAACDVMTGWRSFDSTQCVVRNFSLTGAGFRHRTHSGFAASFARRLTKVTHNMISRDYTKEVGLPSHKKNMSRPLAFIILAAVAVTISFGVAGVVAKAREHDATEKAAAGGGSTVTAPASAAAEPAAAK